MTETLNEELDRIGPKPYDLKTRLQHVLRVYEGESAERELVTATRNVYGPQEWTGLTFGDLRQLANWIERLQAIIPEARPRTAAPGSKAGPDPAR